jgi:hypothetical protein
MKNIVVILLLIISSVAFPRTIVLDSDPKGAEIWQNGEKLGKAPITIEGPVSGSMELTVIKTGCHDTTHIIEIPDDGEDRIYVLSATKSSKSVVLSILAGLGAAFIVPLLISVILGIGM